MNHKSLTYILEHRLRLNRKPSKGSIFNSLVLAIGLLGLCAPNQSEASTRAKTHTNKYKEHVVSQCSNQTPTKELLACVLYKESIGDKDRYGMKAVIGPVFVLINRSKQSGETLKEVIFKDGAISSMNHRVNKIVVRNPIDEAAWKTSLSMAKQLLKVSKYPEGVYSWIDPTRGATYYYHKSIRPVWSKEMKLTARLGSHIYRYGEY